MKSLGKAVIGLSKYLGTSPYTAAIKEIAQTIAGAWTFTSAFIVSVTTSTLATFTSTAANPSIILRYNKASAGVANDELAQLNFEGKDSANALVRYGAIDVIAGDPTAGSVDGTVRILPAVASVETAAVSVANGVLVGAPTGSYQGTGTLNATGLFVNGAAVLTNANAKVAQRVYASSNTYQSCTTDIPQDDTIPQITEGDQVLTTGAVTPTNAASTMDILVVLHVGASAQGQVCAALFQVGTSNALSAATVLVGGSTSMDTITIHHSVSAASLVARTYTVRLGPDAIIASAKLNGDATARIFGGVQISSIEVIEYLP